jgi:hypothetical protein
MTGLQFDFDRVFLSPLHSSSSSSSSSHNDDTFIHCPASNTFDRKIRYNELLMYDGCVIKQQEEGNADTACTVYTMMA